jgi:ubiquitin-protein ligase
MASNVGLMRLKKELKMLYEDPPPGISAWAQEENFHEIEAGAAHMPLGNLRAGSHC